MSVRITESDSRYDALEDMSTLQLLTNINTEDKTVPLAVEAAIPMILALTDAVAEKLSQGGRLRSRDNFARPFCSVEGYQGSDA